MGLFEFNVADDVTGNSGQETVIMLIRDIKNNIAYGSPLSTANKTLNTQ